MRDGYRGRIRCIAGALAMGLWAGTAGADDSAGEFLPTGGLQFVREERISMEEESLFIGPALVEVSFLFKNLTRKPIETTVMFPLPTTGTLGPDPLHEDIGSYIPHHDFGFRCWADGRPVAATENVVIECNGVSITEALRTLMPIRNGQYEFNEVVGLLQRAPPAAIAELERLKAITTDVYPCGCSSFVPARPHEYPLCGQRVRQPGNWETRVVYSWKQVFPAAGKVHLMHRYWPSGESDSIGAIQYAGDADSHDLLEQALLASGSSLIAYRFPANLGYVLKTGNNWNPPIRRFSLLLRGGDLVLAMLQGAPVLGPGHVSYESRDFVPSHDLAVHFGYARDQDGGSTRQGEPDPEHADHQPPSPRLFRIDGPANLRESPGGAVLRSLPDESSVWVLKGSPDAEWVEVVAGPSRAWLHRRNLREVWAKPRGEAR